MIPKERRLTYSEYINDSAIIEALRIPQPPPDGQTNATWPLWHGPGEPGGAPSVEWRPGDMWPRGPNWSHHEVLFIRTHQAFEVWFGVVLHELSTVLLEAKERCGLDGNQVQQVRLGDRAQAAREFSPNRFPKLANVAKSFHHDFIKNRVFMLPAPGRHSLPPGVHLPEETLRRLSASVQRAAVALKVTIPFFDVLTTLTPKQFLEFRNRLALPSGFGSTQFRELEMVFGIRELSQKRIAPTRPAPDPL